MTIQITTLDIICRFVAGLCLIGGLCLIFWDSRRWNKMNNKAHLRPKDFDSNGDIIPMSWKEEKGDLISRKALLEAVEKERQFLKDRGLEGAEHILVLHCLPLIDNAPAVEVDEMTQDLINKVNVNIGLAQPINEDKDNETDN